MRTGRHDVYGHIEVQLFGYVLELTMGKIAPATEDVGGGEPTLMTDTQHPITTGAYDDGLGTSIGFRTTE